MWHALMWILDFNMLCLAWSLCLIERAQELPWHD